MSDGYAVVRTQTLSWLLERLRADEPLAKLPEEVAADLRGVLAAGNVRAPEPELDRLRAAGPLLTVENHLELLEADPDLNLPKDRTAGEFWRLVAGIVHSMLRSEAEAVLQIIGGKDDG